MKRILLLLTVALLLAAAMALSGVAQAKLADKPAGGKPSSKCQQEAVSLSLDGYNFIGGGNKKNDDFTGKATAGPDVFCGFGGDDRIGTLDEGDIFLGGDGTDTVVYDNFGTFYGGAGDDSVDNTNYDTFYGEDGNDYVNTNSGFVYGGAGDDSVNSNATISYGGDGNDYVDWNAGTFVD